MTKGREKNSGFHVVFDNNWEVSAQWQNGAYVQEGAEFPIVSYLVECVVSDSEGNPVEWSDSDGSTVNGHLSADQFAVLLANVKAAGPNHDDQLVQVDSKTMEIVVDKTVKLSDEETGGNPFA